MAELTDKEKSLLCKILTTERNNIEAHCFIEGMYYPHETLDMIDTIITKLN